MEPVIELDGLEVRFGKRTILNEAESVAHRPLDRPAGAERGRQIDADQYAAWIPRAASGTARIFGHDIRTHARAGAQPDRLHAGERLLHRRDDRRAVRPADGGACRTSAGARAGARARGVLLCRSGRGALPQARHLLARHEADGQARAGHRARTQAALSRRAHQRTRPARRAAA